MIVNGVIVRNTNTTANSRTSGNSSSNSSSSSSNRGKRSRLVWMVQQWSVVVGVLVVVPMSLAYVSIYQFLRQEHCSIRIRIRQDDTPLVRSQNTTTTTSSSNKSNNNHNHNKIHPTEDGNTFLGDGLYCKGQQQQQRTTNTEATTYRYFMPVGSLSSSGFVREEETITTTMIIAAPQIQKLPPLPSIVTLMERMQSIHLYTILHSASSAAAFSALSLSDSVELASSTSFSSWIYHYDYYDPKKQTSSSPTPPQPILLTTYVWLVLNSGLCVWYWNHRVTAATVSLNHHLVHDFGRAISGHLAHFDVWHLGMNMMTVLSVGEVLEQSQSGDGVGTIPLFLWTGALFVYTTLGVLGVYGLERWIVRRVYHRHQRRVGNSTSIPSTSLPPRRPFPNMVGFSGILFAWSVYMTLSLVPGQQICPLPILSQVCFETYRIGSNSSGGSWHWKFNWGPFVQLVALQVLLPRVSFVGHLSGILMGFLWYSHLLPPLEISQPAVLYPVVWLVGKYLFYHYNQNDTQHHSSDIFFDFHNNNDRSMDDDDVESSSIGGTRVGGGHILGGRNGSNTNNHNKTTTDKDRIIQMLLRFIRYCLVLHCIMIVWVYRHTNPIFNSILLSELLLLGVFSLLIQASTMNGTTTTPHSPSTGTLSAGRSTGNSSSSSSSTTTMNSNPFRSIGIVGRGYIAFVVITIVTDAMTVGGWLATRGLWTTNNGLSWMVALVLFLTRFWLWTVSIAIVCCLLDRNNGLLRCSDNNSGDSSGDSDGIWYHCFGLFLIPPCHILGKAITENRFLIRMLPTTNNSNTVWNQSVPLLLSSSSSSSPAMNSINERRANILSSRGEQK